MLSGLKLRQNFLSDRLGFFECRALVLEAAHADSNERVSLDSVQHQRALRERAGNAGRNNGFLAKA